MNNPAHILVVDDDPASREATIRSLESVGYEITNAKNGTEALQFAAHEQPDLILLNVMLPDINGIEVCHKIKANPELHNVVVILILGIMAESEHHAKGLDSGADDYISRPVSNRELIARVKTALRIKQAEDSIQANQQRCQSIFMDSPIGIKLYDQDGALLEINPACIDLFGLNDPMDSLNFNMFEDPHLTAANSEKLRDGVAAHFEVAYDFETIKSLGLYQTNKSGIIHLDVMVTPLIGQGNKIQGYLAHFQDISERKHSEISIQQNQANISALIENSTGSIWAVDKDFRLIVGNSEYHREVQSTLNRSFLPGDLLINADLPDNISEIWHGYYKRALQGEAFSVETPRQLGDTSQVMEYRFNPIYGSEGQVDGVTVVGRDISEQKQIQEALQMDKEIARKYFEIAGVMFIALNENGQVSLVNRRGCEILGYDRGEILGKDWFNNFIPAGHRATLKDIFNRLMTGELKAGKHGENKVLTKNGQERIISWHNTVITNEFGDIAGTLSSGEDVTEQKRIQDQLHQSQAVLEQSVKDRTQELAARVEQVEKLNLAITNLLSDLQSHQISLETTRDELQAAHEQMKEEHIQEQALLLRLSQGLLTLNDKNSIMQFSLEQAKIALNAEFAAIALVDDEGRNFGLVAWDGWPSKFQKKSMNPLDSHFAMAKVIRNKTTMALADITKDYGLEFPALAQKTKIRSALLVPLISGEKAIGGMALHGSKPRHWSEEEIRLLALIGNTTAQAMERSRLFEFEQNARSQAETIAQVSQIISASLDIKTILNSIMENIARILPHDTGSIFVNYPDGSLEMVVARG